ncbi:hypothetical protein [Hymenobacter ruricola]|uniref:Curlin associated repeat-containing protein n=1 Tax=Hymenobacter ruricola TaxID=2791023 RepID=A0ABS0I8J1_9BACT|nr:hypothetical protein [Hymenobacter ruricola]MBF9223265.1 hypothetical protein [Hymenobacter ruricola]
MKKITFLLGAALLLAGTANAQLRYAPTTSGISSVGTSPGAATRTASNNPGATARPDLGTTTTINNDSYVQQIGDGQMANVSQTGTGRNTADIDQSPSLLNNVASANGGNYASQVQKSTGSTASGDQNQANIRQHGGGSTATQDQEGIRNIAVIQQGNKSGNLGAGVLSGNDFASQKQKGNDNTAKILQNTTRGISNNSATQDQNGNGNNALASQEYQDNTSVQKQGGINGTTGNNNQASVIQKGLGQYANQNQEGNSNLATINQSTVLSAYNQGIQLQRGNSNQAAIQQSTSNNFTSQSQIGNNNFAETVQSGNLLRDAAYNVITQQGNNNMATVHQGGN